MCHGVVIITVAVAVAVAAVVVVVVAVAVAVAVAVLVVVVVVVVVAVAVALVLVLVVLVLVVGVVVGGGCCSICVCMCIWICTCICNCCMFVYFGFLLGGDFCWCSHFSTTCSAGWFQFISQFQVIQGPAARWFTAINGSYVDRLGQSLALRRQHVEEARELGLTIGWWVCGLKVIEMFQCFLSSLSIHL